MMLPFSVWQLSCSAVQLFGSSAILLAIQSVGDLAVGPSNLVIGRLTDSVIL
jgi:hypothetical protein